jgi:signal transduction histidine kinase
VPTRERLIMIVEDDRDSALLLEDILGEADFRTVSFANGADALQALDSTPEIPDLIMLDLMMPKMDGWMFRVEQRKRGRLRDVPVAVMSADTSAKAEAIDADVFLRKPLAVERVVASIEGAILAHERRKLATQEVELERLRSMGMLLGSVAHELSNPLQYVTGFLGIAAKDCERLGESATSVLRSLQAALSATEGMRTIVKDLRIFSRAESEEHTAQPLESLKTALRLSEPTLRTKSTLRHHWPVTLPRVVGNEARLSQVFLNLLLNAAQAITSGCAGDNSVETFARHEGQRVVIEISDTGAGMPPEVLARVFEPFFTTKSAEEGTGLGLSFSRETIENYGGSISARSVPGEGSTFRIELPIVETLASCNALS